MTKTHSTARRLTALIVLTAFFAIPAFAQRLGVSVGYTRIPGQIGNQDSNEGISLRVGAELNPRPIVRFGFEAGVDRLNESRPFSQISCLHPAGGTATCNFDSRNRDTGLSLAAILRAGPKGMPFPPHWGMYVGAPNLEAAVARVEKLKGKALSPVIDVPGIGRMRTMADPQGAAFSLYEPARPPHAEAKPELRDVSWNELMTTDAAAGLKFYGELFGWKERNAIDMGAMGKYYEWGREWSMGGMMNKPAELAQVPPHWGFYFRVEDVHKGAERVKQSGGQVANGPMEVPGGSWIVNCIDPQGAHFSLHHM